MSLRIGSRIPASSTALRKTNDERVQDKKTQAERSHNQRQSRAIDDAAGMAASDKMGELLQELQQSLAKAGAGLTSPDTSATTGSPAPGDGLDNLQELASGASNVFASQTRVLPPDVARVSARRTAEQMQARPEQAVLGQATMIPSSVLNLLH